MGNIFIKIKSLFARKEIRACMVGLDGAGKTTILYKLKINELIHSIPTIGFNIETIQYRNMNLSIWDIGGQEKVRSLWDHYYDDTSILIFVVDSCDYERFFEIKEILDNIIHKPNLANAKIIVMANKQDVYSSKKPNEILYEIGLNQIKYHDWTIIGTSGITGDGLDKCLEWIYSQSLNENIKKN